MSGETYIFCNNSGSWTSVNVKGQIPCPRAAHAAVDIGTMQMVVYGGASGGGALARGDLYMLQLRNGEEEAQWMIIPVAGETPGRRYGHTLVFKSPYLILFGGNDGKDNLNDVWTFNI